VHFLNQLYGLGRQIFRKTSYWIHARISGLADAYALLDGPRTPAAETACHPVHRKKWRNWRALRNDFDALSLVQASRNL
jgi:hypothetical protein